MKVSLAVASLLFLAVSAQAQTHGSGFAPTQLTLSGSGSPGGFNSQSLAFSLPVIDRSLQHYSYVYEQGSATTFEPTKFVSFDRAVKIGKDALAYRPKSIVEVAAECRAARKKSEAANRTKE